MREPLRQDTRSVSRIETRKENTDRYQNPVEEGREGKEDEEGKGIRASMKFGHAGRILPQHQP
jgi:hypothetical protein